MRLTASAWCVYSGGLLPRRSFFFFFNDTATTEIYTLSLHDALPICRLAGAGREFQGNAQQLGVRLLVGAANMGPDLSAGGDRKSTRLNSSHDQISYAVFCLKKKKTKNLYIYQPTELGYIVCHIVAKM